ncbi:Activating signal cointegrator 1 complex subunit 2 [Hondaea fermentalgiana]|uniref:Activating signal cointegrator 1 complex subunit 2 n=1 Tax=Hondaea fermentalgiana TaxID=2315210 RepID=A0A2R5H2B1_9STRA|nr:Activating signal cointegrator 1 complex subunit 2 [Hondaea fermentalgiana]|eukprot:GBG34524.1 Activating signal cointegrator 1 complex subunit 2 [Hondaea fermentalgiana]
MGDTLRKRGEALVRKHKLTFVPFVEQDNDAGSLEAVGSEAGLRGGDLDDRGIVEVANQALEVLLRAPYVDFLGAMLFDKDLGAFLDTYLETRRRPWDQGWRALLDAEETLEGLVFACLHRVVLDTKGIEELRAVDAQTANTLGMELAASGVISAPRILDICALFAQGYPSETSRVVKAMLSLNDALQHQLAKNFGGVKDGVLSTLIDQLADDDVGDMSTDRDDLTFYLADVMNTIAALIRVMGIDAASRVLGASWESHDDLVACFDGYSRVVPSLTGPSGATDLILRTHGQQIRRGWLALLHAVLWHRFWRPLNIILPSDTHGDDQDDDASSTLPFHTDERIEALLEVLLAVINPNAEQRSGDEDDEDDDSAEDPSQSAGICDYDAAYDLQRRLDYLADEVFAMNHKERIEYTASIIADLVDVSSSGAERDRTSQLDSLRLDNSTAFSAKESARKAQKEAQKENAAKIQKVKDVLPDLGSFFIDQLLRAKGGKAEAAIQAMLEGDLPPQVATLDTTLEHAPLRAVDRGPSTARELFSQFDGSHKGGGGDGDDNGEDEDEEMRIIKDRIRAAAAAYDEYNDEYDDAYDDAGFEVGDDGTLTEKPFDAATWRPGMRDVDGVRRDADGRVVKDPEEEDGTPVEDLLRPNLNHLVEAPTNTKSKKRRGGGGGGGGGGRNAGNSAPSQGNASANAKSHSGGNNAKGKGNNAKSGGGEKDGGGDGGGPNAQQQQRQRRRKDQQKAKVANHSRKRGAAKKQQKTMFGA